MKKLLFQLDTDPIPNTFDTVVAYDAGVDHVTGLGGVTPENVGSLVDGAVFTRPPAHKKFTALFVTGSNLAAGTALFNTIRHRFFGKFRVSLMLDSNGANSTAASAVSALANGRDLHGKRAVILAGTGPVGQRTAAMLALEGAEVMISSRDLTRGHAIAATLNDTFKVNIQAVHAQDATSIKAAIERAQIVAAMGAGGVTLLQAAQWQNHPTLELILDANATVPAGIEGIEMSDNATPKHGKLCFGALGFGGLKLQVQRTCIARLFDTNDQVFDAAEVLAIAKQTLLARGDTR